MWKMEKGFELLLTKLCFIIEFEDTEIKTGFLTKTHMIIHSVCHWTLGPSRGG
jgi:hypothetical protein